MSPLPSSSLLSMSRAELEQDFTATSSSGAVPGGPRLEPLSLQPSSQDKSHHQLCQSQGEMITSSCIHSCIHQNFPPSIISINMSIKMGNANVSSFYKVLAQEITDVVASH